MGAYTRFVSSVLFPLHERLKGHDTVRVRRELEASQWLSPGELQVRQRAALKRFLAEVGEAVPYYREAFRRAGVDLRRIDGPEDLAQLPLLTKSLIREHFDALRHPHASGLGRSSTGGSSGEPLIFGLGKERVSHDVAAKWRAMRWWGVDIGDPEIVVWGSPIELGAQDRLRLLRDWALRSTLLPAFEMSPAKLDAFVEAIRRRCARMLFGYPSALTLVATHAERRGVRLNDLGCRVAFVTGERLYEDQRATIARVFGCPVANGYGGRDAGFVAHECPQGGMHIAAEDILVELIDADGHPVPPGTPGEIVVTHLATRDFPFVRYRTGDIAVLDDRACACGRGLPLLREIQGRSNDFVVAADGTVMQGAALTYTLRETPGIEAFKIVQESLQRVRVMLVVTPAFPRGGPAEIVSQFRRRLGSAVDVAIEIVDHIAPEKSGKYRYIISHVTAPLRTAEQQEAAA